MLCSFNYFYSSLHVKSPWLPLFYCNNSKLIVCVCVCVLVTQSHSTLCDSMNYSLPGSSVHGILQAQVLERVAISFSRGSSQLRD